MAVRVHPLMSATESWEIPGDPSEVTLRLLEAFSNGRFKGELFGTDFTLRKDYEEFSSGFRPQVRGTLEPAALGSTRVRLWLEVPPPMLLLAFVSCIGWPIGVLVFSLEAELVRQELRRVLAPPAAR